MKNYCKYLSFFMLLLVAYNGIGQEEKLPFGFHFEKERQKSISIPFKVYSNLIVVRMTIDESDTLNFVVDTGVSSVIVTDPKIGEQLGCDYVRAVTITGAGEEEPLLGNISIGHAVQVGGVKAYNQNIIVLSEDVLHLSEFMGIPIHGIFGHDLFLNFVVTIDYGKSILILTKPKKFRYRRRFGKRYPLVVTNSKPYTDAFSIKASKSKEEIPVRLVIDTGAGHALLLNAGEETIPMPDKVIRANLGRGLNGDISGFMGRVYSLKMGELEVNDVLASFPDSISFSMKFPPTDYNRQGSVGCEFLRRFKVTFNYRDGYMALKPNKKKLKQSFEHDMSGITVRAKGERYNQFVISQVAEESPAFDAGLRVGDEILFLNNKSAEDMGINEVINTLSRKAGNRIDIFFRRNGSLDFATFVLKRII